MATTKSRLAVVVMMLASSGAPALAQEPAPAPPAETPAAEPVPGLEGDLETIIVTGSYIKGTPENAALPVDVTSLQDLQDVGAPSLTELVRNLAYTSGNLAETNQFQAGAQAQEGVTTINLRGLGSARTLVLINGRRHVSDDLIGVDLSGIPKNIIGRLEALKEGAAATYGSDAIGGVVNLITREGFHGIEVSASEQFISESGGDHDVSLLGGWDADRFNVLGAFEWSHRSELGFKERDWGLRPQPDNPQGGWSGIGNPARYLPATAGGTIIGAGGPDPQCALLGGAVVGPACQFQYTFFDNITEKQDTYKVYTEANFDITDETKLHFEGLYGRMDMPEWKTSPSYPPQSLFGPDRLIAPSHPGLIDFKAQNPGLWPTLFGIPGANQAAYTVSRYLGSTGFHGGPQTGERHTEQWRLAAALNGQFFDAVDYAFAISYSARDRHYQGQDMFVERMAFALDGLGGPNCTPSTGTPGAGGCLYYNPFSNAIQRSVINGATNPQYNPAVANDPDLIDWLVDTQKAHVHNDLLVWDAVLSGMTPLDLGAGEIGWALGFQARREKFSFTVNDLTNLTVSPCPFNDPFSVTLGNISLTNYNNCQSGLTTPTGPLAFLAGTYEEQTERTVYAFFGELSIPILDSLDAQFALRFEDYGGAVGSTVDPKLALRYQPIEWLTLRGSISTTFRAPPQSFLGGRVTALNFIVPANAFKAVDTLGNPDLKPESALATNVGGVFEWQGVYASLDYWRFDFTDPFQTENPGQIVTAYTTTGPGSSTTVPPEGCQNGGSGLTSDPALCAALRSHVFPLGTPAAALERVEVNWINGADIVTSGIDFYLQYQIDDLFGGTLTVGSQGTYTLNYDSDDFLDINGALMAEGGDFNGQLNDGNAPFTPKPEFKNDVFLKYNRGIHNGTIVGRYTTGYEDLVPPRNPAVPPKTLGTPINGLDKIDNHFVLDMHYTVRLFDESTMIAFSILNLTDEDPPFAATDLNYDPFTADPRGRIYKLALTYTWSPQ
jgi:iron complex outermembrane receptor protein